MAEKRLLDKKRLMEDFAPKKLGCMYALFIVPNVLLLFGMISMIAYGIGNDNILVTLLCLPLPLFFFTGNTIAMIYETKHKKGTSQDIQYDNYAIVKCHCENILSYYDNSSDTPTTTLYMEYSYYEGICKFTWLVSVSANDVRVGSDCYALMTYSRSGKFTPLMFYLIDDENGYTGLAPEVEKRLINEPLVIAGKYGYPKYNNNGLKQIEKVGMQL